MGKTKEPDGDGDVGEFDPNAFEHKQEAEKLAALKEDLGSVVTSHDVEGVGETPITKLDALSSQWRQIAVQILKQADPESYAKYRDMKYPDGKGSKPNLATRKKAYAYAVRRFLDLTYTEIEPEAPTKEQVVGEGWRQRAVQLLRVIDPDGYTEYRKLKYGWAKGAKPGHEPDLKTRKAAYAFAVARFLEASYKIAGF